MGDDELDDDGSGAGLTDLSTSLVASLDANVLADVASNAGDIVLDGVLDGGLLDGVPVFGTLVSLARGGMSIQSALFRMKVARFLVNFATTDTTKRAAFVNNLRSEGKAAQFAETILLLLERADDMAKADLIGRMMAASAAGNVELPDALRVSRIIDRSFVEDLRTLPSMLDGVVHRDETTVNALFSAGLLDNVGIDAGGYDQEEIPGGTLYARNRYARLLIAYALSELGTA